MNLYTWEYRSIRHPDVAPRLTVRSLGVLGRGTVQRLSSLTLQDLPLKQP